MGLRLSEIVPARQSNIIAAWLYGLTIMVICMVVIGGLTRLTDSGLSMVQWRPLTGWLPPLSNVEWQSVFDHYKSFPEYKKINPGMSLPEFKDIFWLEYFHRLWGRFIGIAFVIPFAIFIFSGWINIQLGMRLFGLLVLGGAQGGMGWYMVQSGLSDQPTVSQYRLVAHLGLAMLIIASLFWVARGLDLAVGTKRKFSKFNPNNGLRRGAIILPIFVFVTACSGALVAGLNAGLAYNTFPLMDGQFIPSGLFSEKPVYLNFFENIITVQFDHRVLAIITGILVLLFLLKSRQYELPFSTKIAIKSLMIGVILQIGLGVSTLLLVVPITLAALHQTIGVMVFLCSVWVLRELTPP